ncbi:hypothetical protein [Nevskia sp.]|uniref:hypothetical protein n=1 Tax=Nevskia sp. TaxID=1929292 RepID=UPI0025F30380|nr:hypothetical protein [Nevskia sp.]
MTNTALANQLRDLSAHMDCVALDMLRFRAVRWRHDDPAEIAARARELLGTSGVALTWARHLDETADDNRDPGDEATCA